MKHNLPKKFKEGVRVLLLLRRNKEGGPSDNCDRKAIKRISKSIDEFDALYSELKEKKNEGERIYSCVNARNIKKAITDFRKMQLEAENWDEESRNKLYIDSKNRFISKLMKPKNRNENYFLIDCDNNQEKETAVQQIEDNDIEIIYEYETKSEGGYHFVVMPYNPNNTQELEVKRDALILLDW